MHHQAVDRIGDRLVSRGGHVARHHVLVVEDARDRRIVRRPRIPHRRGDVIQVAGVHRRPRHVVPNGVQQLLAPDACHRAPVADVTHAVTVAVGLVLIRVVRAVVVHVRPAVMVEVVGLTMVADAVTVHVTLKRVRVVRAVVHVIGDAVVVRVGIGQADRILRAVEIGTVRASVAIVVDAVGTVDLGQADRIRRAIRIAAVDVQIAVIVEAVGADFGSADTERLDDDVVEVEVHQLGGRGLLVVIRPDRERMGARRQRDVDGEYTAGEANLPGTTADLHYEVVRTVTQKDVVHGNEQLAAFIGFVR